jgi:hypothetical protein
MKLDGNKPLLQVNLLSNSVKFTERGEVILEAKCIASKGEAVTLEFLCKGKVLSDDVQ